MNIKKITAFAAAFVLTMGVLTAVPEEAEDYDGAVVVASADDDFYEPDDDFYEPDDDWEETDNNSEDPWDYILAFYDSELNGWNITTVADELGFRDTFNIPKEDQEKKQKTVRIDARCINASLIKHLYIPDTVKEISPCAIYYKSLDGGYNKNDFSVTYKGNTYSYNERGKLYQAVNGWKHSKSGFYYKYDKKASGVVIEAYDGGKKNVKIPSKIGGKTVTAIGDFAFWQDCSGTVDNATKITSVYIPNSVKTIGASAFCYCGNLKKVRLGKGLKTLDVSAFGFCENLKEITIPNTVTEIAGDAFWGCEKLVITYKGKKYTYKEWNELYGESY